MANAANGPSNGGGGGGPISWMDFEMSLLGGALAM